MMKQYLQVPMLSGSKKNREWRRNVGPWRRKHVRRELLSFLTCFLYDFYAFSAELFVVCFTGCIDAFFEHVFCCYELFASIFRCGMNLRVFR